MGSRREYNPKMEAEWHRVDFRMIDSDQQVAVSQWGRQYMDWSGYVPRRDEAIEFCEGPMIHGRFAARTSTTYSGQFYFKSKKDAMTFKLARGCA